MQTPGRSFDAAGSTAYRYGFNGQEKSTEVSSNNFTAEYWQYDARIGRRWNVDPKPIAGLSPYSTFSGNPIYYSDPLGDTTVTGAGGTQSIDIDDKQNSLKFYSSGTNYKIAGTNTPVPIKPGQLRSFSNLLGTFSATWTTDANGNAVFAGYKNDKGQDLAACVNELNEFASSWKYKLWSFGDRMYEDYQQDPVGHNLKITITLLAMSTMSAVEPVGYNGGYNPSLTTQESMSGIGFLKATPKFAEGSFSIVNWKGYPSWGFKPTGPFRILEGQEYSSARALADKTNAAIHRANPYLDGLQIHELQPVKFGGSPTSSANKVYLTPSQHSQYSKFWSSFLRNMKK
jgi:RHS repeat-associated protein